jgi:hypothetical protein
MLARCRSGQRQCASDRQAPEHRGGSAGGDLRAPALTLGSGVTITSAAFSSLTSANDAEPRCRRSPRLQLHDLVAQRGDFRLQAVKAAVDVGPHVASRSASRLPLLTIVEFIGSLAGDEERSALAQLMIEAVLRLEAAELARMH